MLINFTSDDIIETQFSRFKSSVCVLFFLFIIICLTKTNFATCAVDDYMPLYKAYISSESIPTGHQNRWFNRLEIGDREVPVRAKRREMTVGSGTVDRIEWRAESERDENAFDSLFAVCFD